MTTVRRYYAQEDTTRDDHVVYFDMDGTVADLYAVPNWLDMLISSDPYPYANAAPMIGYDVLCNFADNLHDIGWKVGILSWLSKGSTPEYDEAVIEAKLEWLESFFPKPDEIVIASYGLAKYELVEPIEAILIDDEPENRMHWDRSGSHRRSYPAHELEDLIRMLRFSVKVDASDIDFNNDSIVTLDELLLGVKLRFAEGFGDNSIEPALEIVPMGSGLGLCFYNANGTSYHEPYVESPIIVQNPEFITQTEIDKVFAKVDRIIYDNAW